MPALPSVLPKAPKVPSNQVVSRNGTTLLLPVSILPEAPYAVTDRNNRTLSRLVVVVLGLD